MSGKPAWTGLCPARIAILLAAGVSADGLAQGFTSRSAFNAALPGPASTVDFDGLAPGSTLPSGTGTGGITFTYDLGGAALKVTGLYPAASGANALGSTDADILQDGDELTLGFPARNAIGLSIITKEALQDGDLTLSAGGTSVSLSAAAVQRTLADGSNVYFLGVVHATRAFTGATLMTVGGGYFFFNLDDLTTAAASDTDGDGIADTADNCTLAPNGPFAPDAGGASQRDTNGDGYGNLCDGDLDGSGAVNAGDLALLRLAFGSNTSSANWNPHADFNGSNSVNATDLALFRLMFGKPPGPSGLHP